MSVTTIPHDAPARNMVTPTGYPVEAVEGMSADGLDNSDRCASANPRQCAHAAGHDLDALDVAQVARRAWALAARLDYLTHGAGRSLPDTPRQRMLRRAALDARTLAHLTAPAALATVEGGAA